MQPVEKEKAAAEAAQTLMSVQLGVLNLMVYAINTKSSGVFRLVADASDLLARVSDLLGVEPVVDADFLEN
jgi:hypothetical protein